MIETYNLFEVALGKVVNEYGNLDAEASKYYTKALAFQDKMNEKLATNKVELMQYQAMYYSMFKSQGINKDASYLMSESLTKAGYDIASLYNLETSVAVEKLRAGIAGQVEPLRAIGIDISESALERVLSNVGIERSVQELSYAEKEVARYIAIIEQAGQAQGDFARTFEQPANQLRVFKNQLTELSQVAGAFFVNMFGDVITVTNGIIMAIKSILEAIASLLGWDLSSSGTGFTEVSDTVSDIENGIGGASKKAKEFKKQLMGFDEINNIQLPKDTSSGSGVSGGIDSKLLDSLKEWDNQMDSVKGKAQEIRDTILEWLGFTEDVNGNLTWSWKNMNKLAQIGTVLAGIIAGIFVLGNIIKFVNWLKKLYTVIKTGKGSITTLGTGVNGVFTAIKGILGIGSQSLSYFKALKNAGFATGTAFLEAGKYAYNLIPTMVKVVGGIAGLVVSAVSAYDAMKDFSEGTKTSTETVVQFGISLAGATATGAMLGSVIPGVGTALGALAGATVAVIAGFVGYKNEAELIYEQTKKNNESAQEYLQTIKEQKQAIEEEVNAGLAQEEYYSRLSEELQGLVDSNGRVKAGYEDRVKFILNQLNSAYGTEYGLIDGTIEKYDELKQSIDELIEKKKAEIILKANEEAYAQAIQRQIENQKLKIKAQDELNLATAEYDKKLAEIERDYGSLENAKEKALGGGYLFAWDASKATDDLKKLQKAKETAQETYNGYANAIAEDNETIIKWEDLKTATIVGNSEEISEKIQALTSVYETESGKQESTLALSLSKEIDFANDKKRIYKETGTQITEEIEKGLNNNIKLVADKLLEQTTTVENLTDDQVKAWEILASDSKDIYNEYISKVPEDTKLVIETTTKKVEELDQPLIDKWKTLAEDSEEDYDLAISKIPEDTATAIQDSINEMNRKEPAMGMAGNNLGTNTKSNFDNGLGDTGNSARNFVQGFINVISGNPLGIFQVIGGLATSIVAHFNSGLGNHSPSKKTKQSALYFAKGFQLQLDKEIPKTIKQVSSFANDLTNSFGNNLEINSHLAELNKGVKINTQDYEVDANNFIDYGTVNGKISALSKVEMENSIIEDMATKIVNGINDRKIDVNITTKTDKGTIVETAVNGIKEYTNRTGNLPFTVPV